MSDAIRHLREEHDRLLDIVNAAEQLASRLERNERISTDVLRGTQEVFQLYAHTIHREKEEDLLFPILRDKGVHQGASCVGIMLADHEEGHAAFARMASCIERYAEGEAGAGPEWAMAALQYCELLRRHIHRENDVVFGIAERSLSDDEDWDLQRSFAEVDRKAGRSGLNERMEEAERLLRAAAG